jgi:hypothetical protein
MVPDTKNRPPTAQGSSPGNQGDPWLKRAQEAFWGSTTYLESNISKMWEDSLRAFNNQHPNDSKYTNQAYDKRSRLYRPKLRTIIRKNEAAAAAAFFSNMDYTSIEALDPNNKRKQAGAEVMKQVLQYRLENSIKWFHVVQGGLQTAETIGVVIAHIYWEYEEKGKPTPMASMPGEEPPENEESEEYPEQTQLPSGAYAVGQSDGLETEGDDTQGLEAFSEAPEPPKPSQGPVDPRNVRAGPPKKTEVLHDRPQVKLLEGENFRIHPAADWTDPVNSSPYCIELIPMYVMDVKRKMDTGEWKKYGDGYLDQAKSSKGDSTRAARSGGREDMYGNDNTDISDYEIVWVQRHIHRKDNEDYTFYTLSDVAMLTEPVPLTTVVRHLDAGERPYVMGCCVLEAHKAYPNGLPALGKGLADEANEISNQRIDNVKFVLNKKWFVKRGMDVDAAGLVRNVPGGVVMMNNPNEDVREITWPDVTQSAYEESNRVDNDMNELLGNFNPAQLLQGGNLNSPQRNLHLLAQGTGSMVEYLLRTYTETFVQPVLRQLAKLEAHYETDEVVLALAAGKAQTFERYGIDHITDDMLDQNLSLRVNVGMGATDPTMKLQKFLLAMGSFTKMMHEAPPGLDLKEVGKEVFGHLGYADGTRFFQSDDPQKAMMQQQLQQAMQMIQHLQQMLKDKQMGHAASIQKTIVKENLTTQRQAMVEAHKDRREVATHIRALHEHGGNFTKEVLLGHMKEQARGRQRPTD